MELTDVVRSRHMVRSFSDRPVDQEVLDRLLAGTLRAPTAGNTQGTSWLVLSGYDNTATYWDHATTPRWRERSKRWAGLSRAPIVALSLTSPTAYLDRYGESDKTDSGLDMDASAWPVPYWFGDAAFATMTLLLGAVDASLGACFLGNFRGERELLASLGVPEEMLLFGAILLGHPDGNDHPSRSLSRAPEGTPPRIHVGRW